MSEIKVTGTRDPLRDRKLLYHPRPTKGLDTLQLQTHPFSNAVYQSIGRNQNTHLSFQYNLFALSKLDSASLRVSNEYQATPIPNLILQIRYS